MSNATVNATIVFAFSMVPYLLVSWGYTAFTDGDAKTFWTALGILLGARLFFSLIEAFGHILLWHLYGKGVAVKRAVEFLRANKFPMREYEHDDFANYLCRIQEFDEYPQSVKSSAKEIERELALLEKITVWPATRMWSAWDVALNIYAPRERALKVLT